MTNQQQSVEQVFGAALDLPPEQRQDFLDRACHGAPELRLLVEELLREDERAGSFLEAPLFHTPSLNDLTTGHNGSRAGDQRHPAAPPAPPRFALSHVIADRFVVVRFIARGGMGEVYEVADRLLHDSRVALKVIRPEIAADAASSHRFEQEVLLARKVTHPNLCPIYEIFRCDHPAPAFLYLTMKLLNGETLETRLKHSRPSRDEAIAIWNGVGDGLAAIHNAGIIHRDIKPNNIMLERSGDRLSISIMDFGLARLHESENSIIGSITIAGTPGYLAPELLQGYRPTQATDLFALGVVLHRVLTGERPVEARNGLSVTPRPSLDAADAPIHLLETVKHLLSDDPEKRCHAFEQVRSSQASPLLAGLLPRPRPRILNRRNFLVTSGAAACALAGTAILNRDAIYDGLHPLPRKRFVALLDWPPASDTRLRPMLLGLIDAMANELARAEAFDHNFFVTAQTHAAELKSPAELNEVREALGANLVLAASGSSTPKHLDVSLHVLDPASGRTLRSTDLRTPIDQQFSLPERVVQAAARLLDVSHFEPDDDRNRPGTNNPEALQAFQSAEALIKQPNDSGLDQAIEKYKAAVEADSHYALAYARLSLAYLRLYVTRLNPSSVTLARANAETAVSLDPKLAEAHVALGSVDKETGATPEALHQLGVALSLDPSETRTMTYQAQVYEQMNRWKEAESTYKRVLRLRPNFWLAYNELGNNYTVQGNYIDALAAYRASAAAAPGQALTFNNIAMVLFQLGSFDEALAAVDRSIALAPVDDFYQTRSDILRAKGKYAEALASALRGAKLNPDEGANWLEVGDAYSLLPHHDREAREAYEKARNAQIKKLAVNPNDGPDLMLLALYLVKSAQPQNALALVRKAESLGAADIYSQLAKVRILELLGKRDEALPTLAASMRKGVTLYQVEATHDLDSLRVDPRFAESDHSSVVLPTTPKQKEGRL